MARRKRKLRKKTSEIGLFSHLPEPGVKAGMSVFFALLLGAGLMIYTRFFDDQAIVMANMHWAGFWPLAIIFTALLACLFFVFTWLLEFAWPLVAIIWVLAILLGTIITLYFKGSHIKSYIFGAHDESKIKIEQSLKTLELTKERL